MAASSSWTPLALTASLTAACCKISAGVLLFFLTLNEILDLLPSAGKGRRRTMHTGKWGLAAHGTQPPRHTHGAWMCVCGDDGWSGVCVCGGGEEGGVQVLQRAQVARGRHCRALQAHRGSGPPNPLVWGWFSSHQGTRNPASRTFWTHDPACKPLVRDCKGAGT